MTSAQSEREVKCIANKVRPPPEKDDFEWSIGMFNEYIYEMISKNIIYTLKLTFTGSFKHADFHY